MNLREIENLVGNTPLLKIDYKYEGVKRTIYSKLESFNYTGSIKDRIAYHILCEGYKSGELKEGMEIIEATSGNTGISFSAMGRLLGHKVTIYMPDWMSIERINIIKKFGASIRLVSREEGGFVGSIKMAEDMKKQHPETVFLPRQFDNPDNCAAHYLTTGQEIAKQLQKLPDAFVAGVGTGGTVMGVGKYLKTINPSVSVHPLEPANSPTLSTGYKMGKHRIQGISDELIPSILKLDELDEIIQVDDGDSIIMAQKFASNLGLGVGISSGANFLGAVKLQNTLGDDKVVVTVFADDNKKYLSTDYTKCEPVKDFFLTNNIELIQISAIK